MFIKNIEITGFWGSKIASSDIYKDVTIFIGREDFKNIKAQDVFALPLVYRTNRIIDLLNKSEEKKNKITEPRQRFFDTLQSFMSNKNFFYDNKTSDLSFYLDGNKNESFIFGFY